MSTNELKDAIHTAGSENRKTAGFITLLVLGAVVPFMVLVELGRDEDVHEAVKDLVKDMAKKAGNAGKVTVAYGQQAVDAALGLFKKPETETKVACKGDDDDSSEDHATGRVSCSEPEIQPEIPN